MIPLLVAAALPGLFWEQGPDSAEALRGAGISRILAPAASVGEWKGVPGIAVEAFGVEKAVRVPQPRVQMRVNEASATRSPWVDTNGAHYARRLSARFLVDAPGNASMLAAAEGHMFGVEAGVRTDAAGLEPLGRMLAFLGGIRESRLPAAANIGYVDDGSPESLEVMKLLVRRNLLFRMVEKPDTKLDLSVVFGSEQYPKKEAVNPSEMAARIRSQLTDQKRKLRIYGSEVVVGRLESDGRVARLHLLNYAGPARPVMGIRVRVLGNYPRQSAAVFGAAGAALTDALVESGATEFTLTELPLYAVVDLSR